MICRIRYYTTPGTMQFQFGNDAELEAACNILDVISGDTPRGALNEALLTAA